MKRIVFDIDGTLTVDEAGRPYHTRKVRKNVRDQLIAYKARGFTIILASSRNMRTHDNSIGIINAKTLPILFDWLERNDIPYDEIHIGKPWCGEDGFYVDDKAIRPSELLALDYDGIRDLLAHETKIAQEA